jgi:hypothetical protein
MESMVTDLVIDRLAGRIEQLAPHKICSIAPLLALADELLEDAGRQYNQTAQAVLMRVRDRLVEVIEEAVSTDRWISVREAADIASRPEGTIRYWCRHQLVVARKSGPRDWEIDRDSLNRRAAA